jgi:hypothetical protein
MLDKVGRTLLLIIFLLMILAGANMAIKIAVPSIRKVSPSLADTLGNIV